jgi:hypothetical protein
VIERKDADLAADFAEGLRALDEGWSAHFDDEAVTRIKRAGRAKLKVPLDEKTSADSARAKQR